MTAARWRDDADDLRGRLRPNGGEQAVVAFQGERGAYGHLAIEGLWGARAWVMPCWSFADVIAAVEQGRAGYAVLPVHNEIIGEIPGVHDAIAEAGLAVIGEVRQAVRHCLLGVRGSALTDITAIYSHPAALAQCHAFLARSPAMIPYEAYDTAGAARDVAARGRPHEGAIADEGCAERYGLQLLARDIGDRDDNATVFAVVRGEG
jgi:prephenate dehydratase